jgi:hypothetical protein
MLELNIILYNFALSFFIFSFIKKIFLFSFIFFSELNGNNLSKSRVWRCGK